MRAWVLVVLVSLSAGVALGEVPDAGAPDAGDAGTPSFVEGAFRLVDPSAADRALTATIEEGIRGLHPSMREPFRAQLGVSMRLPRRLVLARGEQGTRVGLDGTTLEAPLDGSERRQTGLEGRPVRVTHRLVDDALVEAIQTSGYQRTNRIRATPGGLRLEVELRSGLLPHPLVASAEYVPATP